MPRRKLTEEEREERRERERLRSQRRRQVAREKRDLAVTADASERTKTLPSQAKELPNEESRKGVTEALRAIQQNSDQDIHGRDTSAAADVTASDAAPATLDHGPQKRGQEQVQSQPTARRYNLRERKSASPGAESQATHDAVGIGAGHGALPIRHKTRVAPARVSGPSHSTHGDGVPSLNSHSGNDFDDSVLHSSIHVADLDADADEPNTSRCEEDEEHGRAGHVRYEITEDAGPFVSPGGQGQSDLQEDAGISVGLLRPVSWLETAVALIESRETQVGRVFLDRQAAAYRSIIRDAFSPTCGCPSQPAQDVSRQAPLQDDAGSRLSLNEMTRWVQDKTGPLEEILRPAQIGRDGKKPLSSQIRQWEEFLARPPGQLSLERSDCRLPTAESAIERAWDIDSIWIGPTSLEAIRPENNSFRLSFVPPYMRALAGEHIIQPHGIDLGHTRHTFLGSVNAGGLHISAFLFFPKTNDGRKRMKPRGSTKAELSPYLLSLRRQKELVDQAILPAVRRALPALYQQEMPATFDIANAKAKSYQERPGTNRWNASDESRKVHLRYTIPGPYLGAFWRELEERCNQIRIEVARGGDGFPYFQNLKLHFQVHDTKNVFARPTVALSLDAFVESVMESLDPAHLDFRSCWVDIGFRDMPSARPDAEGRGRPVTLLWKRACMQEFHRQICDASPDMRPEPEYYRSYHMRDIGGYTSKARGAGANGPRPSNPGNPSCAKVGVVHSKAYNCNKELFSVMFSDYKLFGAPSLSALALDDDMVRDLFAAGHGEAAAVSGAPMRERLALAWEANKRHLLAVAQHGSPTNGYAVRKEVTFRLDVILVMHQRGEFGELGTRINPSPDVDLNAADGATAVGSGSESRRHYPFWVLATEDINAFIFTLAGRFIKPLDHLFAAGRSEAGTMASAQQKGRLLIHHYTAQLFLRLLVLSLTSETERYQDRWIWDREWRVSKNEGQQRVAYIRRGLGLMSAIQNTGMIWVDADDMDWVNGHLSVQQLLQVYIPRDPQHSRWASQANIRAFAHTNVSASYLIEDLLVKAAAVRRGDRASLHVAQAYEQMAARIAVEEVAREYSKHFLSKLKAYWTKACDGYDGVRRAHANGPSTLVGAMEDALASDGRVVTPLTVLDIFDEAWRIHPLASGPGRDGGAIDADEDAEPREPPGDLPYWMSKRSPRDQLWTSVVYKALFDRERKVTWSGNTFRLLHEHLRGTYDGCRHEDAEPFDSRFAAQIGRYILVMFNPDKSKEVNTSHGATCPYGHLPAFFRIQFWAPVINPSRYNAGTHTVTKPTFPLSSADKSLYRVLQMRNLDLVQSFRHTRALNVTASEVAGSRPDVVYELASELVACHKVLLGMVSRQRLQPDGRRHAIECWDFNSPASADLGLWEAPVEIAGCGQWTVPAVVLPTAPVLRFLVRTSRAALGATGLFAGPAFRAAREALDRLRGWMEVTEQVLASEENRRCLVSNRLGALEEAKEWRRDASSDELLLRFLDLADTPQTRTVLEIRGDDGERLAEDPGGIYGGEDSGGEYLGGTETDDCFVA
ncbi:hypothetical protein O9K51_10330 [Purpureocillium lavendulum]|uniref:Uncharacterized protein n=1 Tax=Purpureocillium lavendulum TaxID=1247861 RepID=A0AB34FCU6_9HYPO|nr:hypothetical protein O9K51_10330 [Purpureocillium lavendulum]